MGFIPSTKPHYKKGFETKGGGYNCELFGSVDNAPAKIVGKDETPRGDYADAMTFWEDKCDDPPPDIGPIDTWINDKIAAGISPEDRATLAEEKYNLANENYQADKTNQTLAAAASMALLIRDRTILDLNTSNMSAAAAAIEAARVEAEAAQLVADNAANALAANALLEVDQLEFKGKVDAVATASQTWLRSGRAEFTAQDKFMLKPGVRQRMDTVVGQSPDDMLMECGNEQACTAIQFTKDSINAYKIMNTDIGNPGQSTIETSTAAKNNFLKGFIKVGATETDADDIWFGNQNNEECGRFIIDNIPLYGGSTEHEILTGTGNIIENLQEFCAIKGKGASNWKANSGTGISKWKDVCANAHRYGCHIPCKASIFGGTNFKSATTAGQMGSGKKTEDSEGAYESMYVGEMEDDGQELIQNSLLQVSSESDTSGKIRVTDSQRNWDNSMYSAILGPGCDTMEIDNEEFVGMNQYGTIHADKHALRRFAENDNSGGKSGPLVVPRTDVKTLGVWTSRTDGLGNPTTKPWRSYNANLSPFVDDMNAVGTWKVGGDHGDIENLVRGGDLGYAGRTCHPDTSSWMCNRVHSAFKTPERWGPYATSFRVSPRPILNKGAY